MQGNEEDGSVESRGTEKEEIIAIPDELKIGGATDGEDANSKRSDLHVGPCGIHPVSDLSFYYHALNNMAGSHKVDKVLRDEIDNLDFEELDMEWTVSLEDMPLRNGLVLRKPVSYKRVLGSLGHGILVQGFVCGGKQEEGLEYVIEMDGIRDAEFKIERETRVSDSLILHPGAVIDAYCIVHGPLVYHGIEFDKYGGVHYNGCAFTDGGYRKDDADDERRRYKEACIVQLQQDKG